MYTKSFKQLSKDDVAIAGGKGASLGEMISKAGIPVPNGFVLLAPAFDRFLEETGLKSQIDSVLSNVNTDELHSVEVASERSRAIINDTPFPEDLAKEVKECFSELNARYVAVRSSATAEDSAETSWAGELESYLNVERDDLLESVKQCWSSLYTPRAIFYRFEHGLHDSKVSVAVVVQKMVESEVSGICFTVHPVTENYDQMVIEAGFGLGEAIVGGLITPDTYVIDKAKVKTQNSKPEEIIIDKYISEQEMMIVKTSKEGAGQVSVPESHRNIQKLDDDKIKCLSEICLRVENHYGFPCDIEWGFTNNRFYVLQSRPITTLGKR